MTTYNGRVTFTVAVTADSQEEALEKIQEMVKPNGEELHHPEEWHTESAFVIRTHLEAHTERYRLNRTPCGLMVNTGHRMPQERNAIVQPGEALTCETCRKYRDTVRENGPVKGEPIVQGMWTLTIDQT